ncbi:hypothetical protein NDU88_002977 [Pleurodeles waltl]|uniref:Uncharacterized protein n=1 Tax=Pleurodeles waltl TaxID=8319 RepID=A0AAV7LLN8_PLEWA|nr:hypothetical protein NDU88_002977 [Pleurodeles waltl]
MDAPHKGSTVSQQLSWVPEWLKVLMSLGSTDDLSNPVATVPPVQRRAACEPRGCAQSLGEKAMPTLQLGSRQWRQGRSKLKQSSTRGAHLTFSRLKAVQAGASPRRSSPQAVQEAYSILRDNAGHAGYSSAKQQANQ